MILNPAILALLMISWIGSLMLAHASFHGIRLLRRWDLSSGSERQLSLERSTYLVSTLLANTMLFQLAALFLFVVTADRIAPLFVGAMCAAGSLGLNKFGYPALAVKMLMFLLGGLWLILNQVDNTGYDYPLIRQKNILLLAILPLQMADTALQTLFFANLTPDIIASCCGSLFSTAPGNAPSGLSAIPLFPSLVSFYATGCIVVTIGLIRLETGKGDIPFGILSALHFAVTLVALVSAISPYIYELPTHHCPFCILQRSYNHIGYPIYALLFTGAVAGTGAALLSRWRTIPSLEESLPGAVRKLTILAVAAYSLLLVVVTIAILLSDLRV